MRSGDPKGVYVDTDCCASCGVPWDIAPGVFAEVTGTCVVLRQPRTATEVRRTLRVFQTQDLNCIRYGGDDPRALRILARAATWSRQHGATASLWDFGYAAVRATARHPRGGVAVVECLADAPPEVETLVYHWIDDRLGGTRRSCRSDLRAKSVSDLPETLERALQLLLQPPPTITYEFSALSTAGDHAGLAELDREYWATFQVLR